MFVYSFYYISYDLFNDWMVEIVTLSSHGKNILDLIPRWGRLDLVFIFSLCLHGLLLGAPTAHMQIKLKTVRVCLFEL